MEVLVSAFVYLCSMSEVINGNTHLRRGCCISYLYVAWRSQIWFALLNTTSLLWDISIIAQFPKQ